MFVLLLVYFGADRSPSRHFNRLMVPWLVWSAIYGALKILQAILEGRPVASEFEPWMLSTGPSIHLWFLPFAFMALVALSAVPRVSPAALWLGAGAASMVSLVVAQWALPIPLAQYFTVLPAALTGLVMARTKALIASPLALAALSGALYLAGLEVATDQAAIAGMAVALAFLIRLPSTDVTRRLAAISFGVYLIHPAVIAALGSVFPAGVFPFLVALLSVMLAMALFRVSPRLV